MSKRTTRLSIEVEWNDEADTHPLNWEFLELPLMGNKETPIKILSFEDFDQDGNQIGAG